MESVEDLLSPLGFELYLSGSVRPLQLNPTRTPTVTFIAGQSI
jgi:hypothetical protein